MAKKSKKRKKSSKPKFNFSFIIIIVVVIVGIFAASKVVYKCDNCGKTSFGAGYEPSVLNSKEQRICESCAEEEHKIVLGLGTSTLDDFKLEINWFGSGSNASEEQE